MGQKSANVQQLDRVQEAVLKLVKPFGFRRKGRTLYRVSDTDLRQIISFQAGMFEIGPPLPPSAAHLRPNMYGKFTVNLAVYVPEIHERTNPAIDPRRIISEASCSIRASLGPIPSRRGIWWSLSDDPGNSVDEIGSLLRDVGLPFLNRFGSRDAIIQDWVEFNEGERSLTRVARIDTAMIHLRRGELDKAKALFEDHLVDFNKNPIPWNHEPYVRELAAKLGLGELS